MKQLSIKKPSTTPCKTVNSPGFQGLASQRHLVPPDGDHLLAVRVGPVQNHVIPRCPLFREIKALLEHAAVHSGGPPGEAARHNTNTGSSSVLVSGVNPFASGGTISQVLALSFHTATIRRALVLGKGLLSFPTIRPWSATLPFGERATTSPRLTRSSFHGLKGVLAV